MIVAVTEWYDNDAVRYYFDMSKVNPGARFEVDFHDILRAALTAPGGWIDLARDSRVRPRFGAYQNSMPSWERLKAKLPCQVDAEVTLVMR